MKRLLVLGIFFAAACATMTQPAGDAEAAIRANNAAFSAAMNSGNLDGVVAMYADDAMVMGANVPAFKGKDGIRQFWGGFLGMGAINLALFTDDVMQRDDLA